MLYSVFQFSASGTVQVAAELHAATDREAMKQARQLLPEGAGELRESGRVVCRFGRSGGFLLKS